VTVAVSTGGRSPVFARHVKALLERALPPGLGHAAQWLARWRQPVRDAFTDEGARRRFWERIIDTAAGHLRVIGVDPRDVDAISIAAHRALTRADLVVLEPDAGRDILQLCRREAAVRELPHAASAPWIAKQVAAGHRVALLRHHKTLNCSVFAPHANPACAFATANSS